MEAGYVAWLAANTPEELRGPLPSVPAVPLDDPERVAKEQPRLPVGPSWSEVDVSGSAVVAVSRQWQSVTGTPVWVRLTPEDAGRAFVEGALAGTVYVPSPASIPVPGTLG